MKSNFIRARLYEAGGDVSKQWYVYYSVGAPGEVRKTRYKVFDDLNRLTTKKARRERASIIIASINELLESGWRPGEPMQLDRRKLLIDRLRELYAEKKPAFRPRTAQSYKGIIDSLAAFLDYREKSLKVGEWARADTLAYLTWLVSVRKVGPRTRNGYRGFGAILFNWLLDTKEIEVNPWLGIRDLRCNKKTQFVAFTDAEAQRLKVYLSEHDPAMWLFCKMIYYTGIRPSELCRLKVSDLDLKRKRALIPGASSKTRDTMYAMLSDELARELGTWAGAAPGSNYVFSLSDHDGVIKPGPNLMHRNNTTKRFKVAKEACDVPSDRKMYSWKHYGAVKAFEAGVSPVAIMQQFRHHSLDMTMLYLSDLGLNVQESYGDLIPRL